MSKCNLSQACKADSTFEKSINVIHINCLKKEKSQTNQTTRYSRNYSSIKLIRNGISWGAWLPQSEEHTAPDLEVVSLSPMLGVEIT